MAKPQDEQVGAVPRWMERWGVAEAWSFDAAGVGGDLDEHGVVVRFADERTRGYYELCEVEADLADRLGIRVVMLTREAVEDLEDVWRREAVAATLRPLVPARREAAHAA